MQQENLIQLLATLAASSRILSASVTSGESNSRQKALCATLDNLLESVEHYLQWEINEDYPYVCFIKDGFLKFYPPIIDFKNKTVTSESGKTYSFSEVWFHKNPFFKTL
jgi:hypothetical protein